MVVISFDRDLLKFVDDMTALRDVSHIFYYLQHTISPCGNNSHLVYMTSFRHSLCKCYEMYGFMLGSPLYALMLYWNSM